MYSLSLRSLLRTSVISSFRGLCSASEPAPSNPEYRRRADRVVPLPAELVKAVERVLADRDSGTIKANGRTLHRSLCARHEPIERREVVDKAGKMQKEIFGNQLSRLDTDERSLIEPQVKAQIMDNLKKEIYKWAPVSYDEYTSLCYLAGRLPYEFTALHQVFKEMRLLDPYFKPQSCLDFGSGVGTVWWALKESYEESFNEYYGVDIQKPMRELARQLIMKNDGSIPFKNFTQRATLPSSAGWKYDVVVSAFSLMELPSQRDRLATIETLWNKTSRHLIILENGTHVGFRLVSEARKFVLESSENANQPKSYALAPCTHSLPCERLQTRYSHRPCSFPVKFRSLNPNQVARYSFSYVILSKVRRPEVEPAARIIEEVLLRPRHVICRLCTSRGSVEEKVITKGKHDRALYSEARKSRWGDLFAHEDAPSASRRKAES